MFNNNSSVSTSINTTYSKKPPVSKPTLSNCCSNNGYSFEVEEDTRTPPSLVCNSPSSMFAGGARKQQQHPTYQHGREVLANITNSKTSSNSSKRNTFTTTTTSSSNLKDNNSTTIIRMALTQREASQTCLLNQSTQYFATGKTNATVLQQLNNNNNNTQFNTSRQYYTNTTTTATTTTTENMTNNQQESEESNNSSSNVAFNDFSIMASDEDDQEEDYDYDCVDEDEEDEYSSEDEEMHDEDNDESEDADPVVPQQPQQHPQPTTTTGQVVDPDMLNHTDKGRLQSFMHFNIKNPVNLLPKSSSRTTASVSGALLPIDVEEDVMSYLFQNQNSKQASPLVWQSVQKIVSAKMRTMLVEWIAGVSVSFKLLPETLYLSIDLLDRFMCKVCITNIKLLQGYGLACLLIAAKYCETFPPPLRQLLFAADNTYSRRVILNLESEICNALDFEFCSIQAFDFVEKFLEIVGYAHDHTVKLLAYYICELQLQNFESLEFNKSTIALSAIVIALHVTKKQFPYPQIALCLGAVPTTVEMVMNINNCIMKMYNYYVDMSWNRNHPHNFIKDKYSRPSFGSIAVTVVPESAIPPRL